MSIFFFFKEKNRSERHLSILNTIKTKVFSQKISAQDRNKVGDHAFNVFLRWKILEN